MRTILSRFAIIGLACVVWACECIEVPASDSTRPSANLLITFTDPDQAGMVTQQVSASSSSIGSPPDLELPAGWPITVTYSGHDAGGVKTLVLELAYLDPTTTYNPDGSISQALIAEPARPDGDFSDCAMKDRTLSFNWSIGAHWSLKATATDFHGNTASTVLVKIGGE